MIKSFLTYSQVIQGEPALDDYLRSDQIDFDGIQREAYQDMVKDFVDMNLNMRKLCIPLSLQTSVTRTAAANGTITDEDYAQRNRLYISVTVLTGDAVFELQGSNDEGESYTTIIVIDEAGQSLTDIAITETGNYIFYSTGFYKKFRLNLLSIGTTITYSAELYENLFTIIHRTKTRTKIYQSLMALQGDLWEGKYKQYREEYNDMVTNSRYYYDSNDDEEIDSIDADMEAMNHNIIFKP